MIAVMAGWYQTGLASMGTTSLTAQQIQQMEKLDERTEFCYDGDNREILKQSNRGIELLLAK